MVYFGYVGLSVPSSTANMIQWNIAMNCCLKLTEDAKQGTGATGCIHILYYTIMWFVYGVTAIFEPDSSLAYSINQVLKVLM